ncbi:hypothetical protein CALCODRAFT_491765 [Calocera cornea HHB12733]|uniref:Uncharacterized protein n=1 Tax=Calocera cornea HHB12733 TaxID=1353952 RepID=A0A165IXH2_9BASI|nr:hypothetical protein CALCODRAFT_491765 [Calocera cornea HHB12733]
MTSPRRALPVQRDTDTDTDMDTHTPTAGRDLARGRGSCLPRHLASGTIPLPPTPEPSPHLSARQRIRSAGDALNSYFPRIHQQSPPPKQRVGVVTSTSAADDRHLLRAAVPPRPALPSRLGADAVHHTAPLYRLSIKGPHAYSTHKLQAYASYRPTYARTRTLPAAGRPTAHLVAPFLQTPTVTYSSSLHTHAHTHTH